MAGLNDNSLSEVFLISISLFTLLFLAYRSNWSSTLMITSFSRFYVKLNIKSSCSCGGCDVITQPSFRSSSSSHFFFFLSLRNLNVFYFLFLVHGSFLTLALPLSATTDFPHSPFRHTIPPNTPTSPSCIWKTTLISIPYSSLPILRAIFR